MDEDLADAEKKRCSFSIAIFEIGIRLVKLARDTEKNITDNYCLLLTAGLEVSIFYGNEA